MNTISSKTSSETQVTPVHIQTKSTRVDGKQAESATAEIMDSPRAYAASAKLRRKVNVKTTAPTRDTLSTKTAKRRPASISTTLHAQMLAGKNDSAEMYKASIGPLAAPARSASPKSAPLAVPERVKLSSLTVKQAAELSDDAFDALSFSSGDEASLNSGWNEWGVGSDGDDEAPKTKAAPKSAQHRDTKQVDEADAGSDEEGLMRWNEWGMTDDDE